MRQVQARAVRQECAEGVEEVERGGRREGWKLSKGGSRCQGTRRDNRSFLLFPLTISRLSRWRVGGHGGTILGRVSLVIPKTAERWPSIYFPFLPAQLS